MENGVYHVYNRGTNHQTIFLSKADYLRFLEILNRALSKQISFTGKNYYQKILLLGYCLMPNHIHLVLMQKELKDMAEFLQSITISYSMYFSIKYNGLKCGQLFQDRYKARLIETDIDLYDTLDYVHNNPLSIGEDPKNYEYSSLSFYNSSSELEILTKVKRSDL